uniref:hypothetical protein n=1 Tax=Streptomyces acidiscabies TaxID=42234 RepID=UPI0015BC632F
DAEPAPAGDATAQVVREVARVEHGLSAAVVQSLDRAAVAARLEALLAKVLDTGDGDGVDRLETATAQQVLDFIDNELGV